MHHTRFVFVLAIVAGIVGCGGVEDKATPTCGSGEVQKGDVCVAASTAGCKDDAGCPDIGTCLVEGMCHAGQCYYTDRCAGSGTTSSTSSGGGGAQDCEVDANADGSVYVQLQIGGLSMAQATHAVVNNDWDGSGWDQTVVNGQPTIDFGAMMHGGVHILNVNLGDGTYLVEGFPEVYLRVPESQVLASFDSGCSWTEIKRLGDSGEIPAHQIRYGWRAGDPGPNTIACNDNTACAVTVH